MKIFTTTAPDFSVFFQTAQNLLAGINIYQDPTLFTGFGYPPFTAALFLPLTVFPIMIAQGIWTIGSLVALLASVWLSLRILGIQRSWGKLAIIFSLAFVAFPTRFTLGMGQVNLVALLFFLVFLYFVRIKKDILGGIVLGLLFVLKPHFMLFLPVLVVTKRWKLMGAGLAVVSIAAIVTGFWFGWGLYQTYVSHTLPPLLVFTGREIYYNQGFGAVFSRLLPLGFAQVFTSLTSILFVFMSLWLVFKKRIPGIEAIIVFLPVFLLIEPLSWQHHYVFLLPTFLWLWKRFQGKYGILGVLGVSYILVSANIQRPDIFSGTLVGNILLSHVFIGNLLLFGLSLYAMARRPPTD